MNTYWLVISKFFDSGCVKCNIGKVFAESKPANVMRENKMCDEYNDYFDTYEEAAEYARQTRQA